MARYRSELMRVVRQDGDAMCTTYYVRSCNAWARTSKKDFEERYDTADGLACFIIRKKAVLHDSI